MLSPADRIVEATLAYTLRPKGNDREKVIANPPDILLTNYMMLELVMTRSGRDVEIRQNILENIKYLVFDELHTYRGRQGSDVSILIRRIKSAASNSIACIGTSATMVSGDATTLLEQKFDHIFLQFLTLLYQ